jgi:hypothetical protein
MADVDSSTATPTAPRDVDVEKADHAVPSADIDDSEVERETSREESDETTVKYDTLSRQTTEIDDDDPFALFPTMSISMSSTRAPYSRRGTVTTLTRPLTREETMQTLRSVRSRFTEVRSEFDENVYGMLDG